VFDFFERVEGFVLAQVVLVKKETSVLYIAMYGQTVRAEGIVPSGTSMGNQSVEWVSKMGKALTPAKCRILSAKESTVLSMCTVSDPRYAKVSFRGS
jgi:hypothetical protein